MYRSGPNFDFGEKPVPKWYVPKWSCTELALTHYTEGFEYCSEGQEDWS